MINYSEISNGDDAINDAWNVYNHQKVLDKKCGKFQNKLITDDDIKLMISRKSSSNLKRKKPKNKQTHTVSLTLHHEKNNKT